MRKGGGKQKGSAFERVVCKALSLWVSGGKLEDVFWRSAMSGGRATVARKKGRSAEAAAGDISAVRPIGSALLSLFLVECKSYKDLQLHGMFDADMAGGICGMWKKLCIDSAALDKMPMMVAKQNGMKSFVLLNAAGVIALDLDNPKLGKGIFQAAFPKADAYMLSLTTMTELGARLTYTEKPKLKLRFASTDYN